MMDIETLNLLPIMPEALLALMGMVLLLFGVAQGDRGYRTMTWYVILTFITAGAMLLRFPEHEILSFGGMFITEPFARFMKLLILVGASLALLLSISYTARERINRFEYPILILFSTLGMFMMVSANDLIALYMGLELQSLPLYVLAALNRSNMKSAESGIKYFVLGALSSGLLLYGCSMVYGFAGTTNFTSIAAMLGNGELPHAGLIIGVVFILAGLAFKVSAVPFHMWAPDVYEGAPSSVVAFFAMVPKIAAMAVLLRLSMNAFGGIAEQWQQVIVFISMASMIVGAVAAIAQTNIKRLMAYSSIGHMGYALIGLAVANVEGVRSLMLYMTIYMIMTGGVFAIILMMVRKGQQAENIEDLAGLAKYNPVMALCMTLFMFSMAGIPPLAGFFGKLFIFQVAIAEGYYTLALVGVLSSVVAAYYYLRIIKVMYFDEATNQLDAVDDVPSALVMRGTAVFSVGFIVVAWPFFEAIGYAAERLLSV